MGNGGQPFMYDAVPKESSRHPYSSFDPKAVSRASLAPKPVKPKQEGPLVSFANSHPDSYMQLPYGNINAKPMSKSAKKRIVQTRWALLVFRVLQLLGAMGSLTLFILISGISPTEGWIMRIPPGIAMLHTVYGVWHLSRKAGGRTPASTASYMAFSAAFDATLMPFYGFSAYMAAMQYKLLGISWNEPGEWTTLLHQGPEAMPVLVAAAFLCTTITGGLHLITLGMSVGLCIAFRKILNLPPDMNPLEDNLTARPHKRNKSELSYMSTSSLADSEKRISLPLETRRNSGAPYEDLSRPPAIPFLHTRTGSTESFKTYSSRDSRLELPSRQYQIVPTNTSVTDLPLKRAGFNTNTPPASPSKRSSYAELPLGESPNAQPLREAWFKTDATSNATNPYPRLGSGNRSPSPKKTAGYTPLHQHTSSGDLSENFPSNHPNPLRQNPAMRGFDNKSHQRGQSYSPPKSHYDPPIHSPIRDPLSDLPDAIYQANPNPPVNNRHSVPTPKKTILNPFTENAKTNNNNNNGSRALTTLSSSTRNVRQASSTYSGDLADASVSDVSSVSSYNRHSEYGHSNFSSLKSKSHQPQPQTRELANISESPSSPKKSFSFSSEVSDLNTSNPQPQSQAGVSKFKTAADTFKAKSYGELRAATPPVMLGTGNASGGDLGTGQRQISSGNDWSHIMVRGRDVSGKIAEEGRGGAGGKGWGTRFRKIGGLGGGGER